MLDRVNQKIGYVVTGSLFVVALVLFIGAIATGVGELAGIGGVLTAGSFAALCATGAYHSLSGLEMKQEQRRRRRGYQ